MAPESSGSTGQAHSPGPTNPGDVSAVELTLRTGKASMHPKTLLSKLNNELANFLQPIFPTILSMKRAKTDQCLYFVLHSFRRLKEDRGEKMNVSKLTFQ